MEDLTKHQLILLTLLVSFVTSIATGIITFTLLQEAPVEVTNTINRVVERTIQQVTPTVGGGSTTKEVQVVSEDELLLASIDKNAKSIVRIKTTAADGSQIVSGLGLVVSDDGSVVVDSHIYDPHNPTYIVFPDGKSYSPAKIYSDPDSGLVFLKLSMAGHEGEKANFSAITLGDSSALKLGQSIIRVSGKQTNSVSVGRISEFNYADDTKTIKKVISDIKVSGSMPGSPFLNNAGEIVGIEPGSSDGESVYSFLPINSVKTAINKGLGELAR